MHRPRAPLSLSVPVPSLLSRAPLSLSNPVPSLHLRMCTDIALPSPSTVIALPRPLRAPVSVHPCTNPLHRYRSLPRSLPAPARTRALSPCTVIALCSGPRTSAYTRAPSCPVASRGPFGPLPAPPRTPVHRSRAPLSPAAPIPPCPSTYTHAPSPCTLPLRVHPCTIPVHLARCPGPLPAAYTRAPSPCSYRSLPRSPPCTPRTRAPSRAPLIIALCPSPPCTRAPSPCTVIPVPSVHPCTIPVHRYRSLPRSPPCPFRTPVHRSPRTVRLVPLPAAPRSLRTRLRDPSVHGFLFVSSSRTRRPRYRALAAYRSEREPNPRGVFGKNKTRISPP